jgi:hypothetical protein
VDQASDLGAARRPLAGNGTKHERDAVQRGFVRRPRI